MYPDIVYPTTIWTRILEAGAQDTVALEDFGQQYRAPVLEHIRARGFADEAEDLCQEVFLRVFQGGVLAKADRKRGRFRSLLRSVTSHVLLDRLRKRRDVPVEELEVEEAEPEFDQVWAWHLTEKALERMSAEGSTYYDVLRGHLDGVKQDRNRLWIARRKLTEHIRREVASTCSSQEDFEQELAYLAPYLQAPKKD